MMALVLAAGLAQTPQLSQWTHLPAAWEAHLKSPGGDLRFGLTLSEDAEGSVSAQIHNRGESIEVPVVEWTHDSRSLLLEFPHYDSRIEAHASDDGLALDGIWRKRKGPDAWTEMAFSAHVVGVDREPKARRVREGATPLERAVDWELYGTSGFYGKWRAQFRSESTPSVAVFVAHDPWKDEGEDAATFTSTFLTPLGDYRYLTSRYDTPSDSLSLSCFDGAHAFLFTAKLRDDNSLAGDFWSGDTWHDTWTAVRDDDATLPDPFGLTQTVDGVVLDELAFPDVEGTLRKLGDPQFAGKARIVQLFGTWCPNCNDETRYLRELDERYRSRGLSIVGLAFEVTGDFARDAQQVRTYAKHHQLPYPLLVAGVSDKKKASERFPLLDRVRAFPTTLFVDAAGRVRAVHQGFSGPATGAEHDKLREDFERRIEALLAESK